MQYMFSLRNKKNYLLIIFNTPCIWSSVMFNFTYFSTVFQYIQDNGWMIMKGCVHRNPHFYLKDLCLKELNLDQ